MSKDNADITGRTFGRLQVIGRDFSRRAPRASYWICVCECGTRKSIVRNSLVTGSTRSCGCLSREHMARVARAHRWKKEHAKPQEPSPAEPPAVISLDEIPQEERLTLRASGQSYRASGATWEEVAAFLRLTPADARELCAPKLPTQKHNV